MPRLGAPLRELPSPDPLRDSRLPYTLNPKYMLVVSPKPRTRYFPGRYFDVVVVYRSDSYWVSSPISEFRN